MDKWRAKQRLYIIWAPEVNRSKIGLGDPGNRLKLCQIGSPCKLVLHATVNNGGLAHEGLLHKILEIDGHRFRGEWFQVHPERVLRYLEAISARDVTTLSRLNRNELNRLRRVLGIFSMWACVIHVLNSPCVRTLLSLATFRPGNKRAPLIGESVTFRFGRE